MTLERDIEAFLVNNVRLHDGETRKLKWIGRNGAPDRLVMLGESIYFVELKSPTGKLSCAQEREMDTLKKYGAKVHVLDSKDAVLEFIEWYT